MGYLYSALQYVRNDSRDSIALDMGQLNHASVTVVLLSSMMWRETSPGRAFGMTSTGMTHAYRIQPIFGVCSLAFARLVYANEREIIS
eukprot:1599675-Pleurochrysis_carterae.AAC.1